jgi:hypothetical protein
VFQHLLVDPLGQSLQEQKQRHLLLAKLQKKEHLLLDKHRLLLQHNKMTK